jgi:hypothetical protein
MQGDKLRFKFAVWEVFMAGFVREAALAANIP